jgi:uncharacterized protein YndB with AHSA1/START domain
MNVHGWMRRRMVRMAAAGMVWAVVQAAGGQTTPLVSEGVVAGPVEKVWAAFTTAEGLKSWMAPHAEFDLRIGGTMRTNYNKEGTLGDAGTIENAILAYEPMRMLTIKVTRAPESFPFKQAVEKMWTVMYFEPLAPDRTRVRVVGMGFTEDEESQKMRKHFEWGNAWTLRKLQQAFGTPATQPADETLTVARRLLGGEWTHESQRPDGKMFRVRNVYTDGPDGKSLIAESWMDRGAGAYCHGRTQVYREPGTGRIMFQNINETGAVARGEMRAVGPDKLEWDWNAQALDGTPEQYRVEMTFAGGDEVRFKLSLLENGGWKQMVDLPFVRKGPATRPG